MTDEHERNNRWIIDKPFRDAHKDIDANLAGWDYIQKLGHEAAQSSEKMARLEAVLSAMYKCFKYIPTMEETGFDTPPEPASQWDYEAFLILAEAERILPPAPEKE